MFFPNVEIAGDGEPRDSLYLLFSEQLYGTKKKKKKKSGRRRPGRAKGREQAAAGGRARAKGARGVCLGGRECVPGEGCGRRVWPQAALARASPAGPHTHTFPTLQTPRPRAADWLPILGGGGKSGGGRESLVPQSSPFLGPGTAIKIRGD